MQNNQSMLASVAFLYYEKGLSQEKIAQKLFISRSSVSRLLQKAIETGIVEIKVNLPFERNTILQDMISEKYGVRECHVLKTQEATSLDRLTDYAASYLEKLIDSNMIIGISSGRTVYKIATQIKGKVIKNTVFSQVKGKADLDTNYFFDSPESIRMVADKFHSEVNLIFSPLYVFNKTARHYLLNDRLIKGALEIARQSDMLIASVGSVNRKESSIYQDYLDTDKVKMMVGDRPVATILGHFLDENGSPIKDDIESSLIGLTLQEIRAIKNKVIIAHGKEKSHAVKSALLAGLVDTIIIDEACCSSLT